MASSLYQNGGGAGRPPPPPYRQNQQAPSPPQQVGGSYSGAPLKHYSYGPGPPPPPPSYAMPPGQSYNNNNPSYAYGSRSNSVGGYASSNQGQPQQQQQQYLTPQQSSMYSHNRPPPYAPPPSNSTSYGTPYYSVPYPSSKPQSLPPPVPPPQNAPLPSAQYQQGTWPSAPQTDWRNTAAATTQGWNPQPLQPSQPSQPPSVTNKAVASSHAAKNLNPKPPEAPSKSHSNKPALVARADGTFESEQQRHERKKREHEKRKAEAALKKSSSNAQVGGGLPHKNQVLTTPANKGTPAPGSRDVRSDRKAAPVVEKIENRLKRPSTFLCKIKFRNDLPDPASQPKLLRINNADQYYKYSLTSLEKGYKHKIISDPDLGIPLDLLDISVYNAPKQKLPMDPEDADLLRDEEVDTVKVEGGFRKKDRPTDKGLAWLVKTTYISPINLEPVKQSCLTEKQAKDLKEQKEGKRNFLDGGNSREQQIQSIEESFKVAKQRPVHQSKPGLEPVEIYPLLPDFDRLGDQFVHMVFDGEPTADSEMHSKLDRSIRDDLEAQAIMKSFVIPGTESTRSEKFLGYMVPKVDELFRDADDNEDEKSYTWVREYHWDVRAEDPQNTVTYVFSFDEDGSRYLPLRTKLVLQKKKAKDRSKDGDEGQYAVPSKVTLRTREITQEEEDEKETQRSTLLEGFSYRDANQGGRKRRMSSDTEMPSLKRKAIVQREQSDDDELSM